MTKKKQEVVKKGDITPEMFIGQAIDKGLSVEAIEKLIIMRRELKEEWAKEQYYKAMSEFQAECPVIEKAKEGGKTKSGEVAYHYAPLDQIREKTKDLVYKHGFSYIFKPKKEEGRIKVSCIVRHKDGWSDETTTDVPLTGGTSVMSASQIEAATLTFAKRYAYCDAFGIVTGGEDDEKNLQKAEKSKNEQKQKKIDIATKLIKERKDVETLEKDIARIKESSYDEMEKEFLILEAQTKIEELKNEG